MENYKTETIDYFKLVKKLKRYHAGHLQYFGYTYLFKTTLQNSGLSLIWKKSCITKLKMMEF